MCGANAATTLPWRPSRRFIPTIPLADLVPTAAHLPLPWIMGYDVEPMVTLETKRRILKSAAEQQWLVVFEHDAETPWGRVVHDGKGYGLGEAR